jgi:SAM-dependent methyltransferase
MNPHPPFPSMPFMEAYAPLLRFFKGMTRKGPGSEPSTLHALSMCDLPEKPVVADFGCGSGASALLLARKLQIPILAMDADGTALDDLWELARAQDLLSLVEPRTADFADPGLQPESLDLIWSEGAIAHIGWSKGLTIWREFLRPGGLMAITDATWFVDDPPAEAQNAWREWYPGMGTETENIRIARSLCLDVVGHFRLPSQDWWDYLDWAEARCQQCAGDEELAEVITGMRVERDLYRRTGHSYGYVFYVLRRI